MAARAIWKGQLQFGKRELPVKLYSAVEDRTIHFRLLHAKDRAPVEQRIIVKGSGDEVAKDEIRKAYAVDRTTAVILQPDELDELVPPESRDISISRFIAPALLNDQWYDRPYFLGPDADDPDYFALAEALERRKVIGIAHWTMRKKRYVGALSALNDYLVLTTLRRADQVLAFSAVEAPKAAAPRPNELKLAEQLVASITGAFDPRTWQNEYRQRLCQLIAAKARGETLPAAPRKKKAPQRSLEDSLKASLAAAKKERKVA